MKICTKCNLEKTIDSFYVEKNSYIRPICKLCDNASSKKYRENNKEKIKESKDTWSAANPGYYKQYYNENKNTILEYSRDHYNSNKSIYEKNHRQYYLENKEQINKNNSLWKKKNLPKITEQNHKRRAKQMNNGGTFTSQEWLSLLERYNHTCLRCFRDASEAKLTADHIVPLSIGGSNSIENIQPLCLSCNSSKGTKSTDYRCHF